MSENIEGDKMLTIPGNARLFLCQYPMTMRKSFEGLCAAVEQLFPGELLSGAFFIFFNRCKDHMKVLFWDNDGFVIWFKRLEKGTFSWKCGDTSSLDRRTFFMLLEGVFRLASMPDFSEPDLVLVTKRIPQGIVCLLSALAHYELTTQIPH